MRQDPDIEISLAGEEATIDLGAKLALNLRAGDCISLIGDLGAGKTTLSRGLIQALLGDDTEVPSPTYTIVQTYETDPAPIWHFDLYRIESPHELIELGFEDAEDDIMVIEWPENAGSLLPSQRLIVELIFTDNGRSARLTGTTPEWKQRLNDIFNRS